MFVVHREPEVIATQLGGTDPPNSPLPEVVFEWLEDSAAGAESLLRNPAFCRTFEKYSQVDSMSPDQIFQYSDLVNRAFHKLRGVRVCVAAMGREYAQYVRPGADENVEEHMVLYVNSHLLVRMHDVFMDAKSNVERSELTMQFTSFLAGKLFHEANHLLLTLVDDLDQTLNLIIPTKDGFAQTPPKRFLNRVYKDFGSLMERVCFGGILLLECWELLTLGRRVLLANDESLKCPQTVPTIATVGKGELIHLQPLYESTAGQKRARATSRQATAASHHSSSDDNKSSSENDEQTEGEKFVERFLPMGEWAAARQTRRATPRPSARLLAEPELSTHQAVSQHGQSQRQSQGQHGHSQGHGQQQSAQPSQQAAQQQQVAQGQQGQQGQQSSQSADLSLTPVEPYHRQPQLPQQQQLLAQQQAAQLQHQPLQHPHGHHHALAAPHGMLIHQGNIHDYVHQQAYAAPIAAHEGYGGAAMHPHAHSHHLLAQSQLHYQQQQQVQGQVQGQGQGHQEEGDPHQQRFNNNMSMYHDAAGNIVYYDPHAHPGAAAAFASNNTTNNTNNNQG